MKVRLITVGKLKEKYWADAAGEYAKRLSRFCKLEQIEIADKKIPERASDAECKKILEDEGEEILKKAGGSKFIALCIEGKEIGSEDFAKKIKHYENEGEVTFVIGSSMGLCDKVKKQADFCMSFSPMTFTHQMAKIILMEQIYRGFKINSNQKYHK